MELVGLIYLLKFSEVLGLRGMEKVITKRYDFVVDALNYFAHVAVGYFEKWYSGVIEGTTDKEAMIKLMSIKGNNKIWCPIRGRYR